MNAGTLETTEGVSKKAIAMVTSEGGLTELKIKKLNQIHYCQGGGRERLI
ncbi:MAG: hypothetical protein V8S95_14055 [Odoribacter sp.]